MAEDITNRLRDIYATMVNPEGDGKRYLDEFTEARLADQFSRQARDQFGMANDEDPEEAFLPVQPEMDLSSPNPFNRQHPAPVSRFAMGGAVEPTEPWGCCPPTYNFDTPVPHESGPPGKVYADGGEVFGDDYGGGRFTRTPLERREARERRVDQLAPYDPSQDEWSHLQHHNFNPLSYGLEAAGRFDRRLGAAREGENGWTWRDIWDNALSPDPRFRDENGIPGAAADALAIGSSMIPGAGPAVRGMGYVAPLVYGAGREAARALGFAGGGKVSKAIQQVGKMFGKGQQHRIEQAAAETNLERIHPEGLVDMFNPKNNNLFVSMPPSAFQDYAARLPDEAALRTPYPRAHNVPGSKRVPRDEQTQDWYIQGLADLMERKGAYAAPELHIGRSLDDLTNVAEHEGRHRAMALDRLGDPRMLVQLRGGQRPFDWKSMDPDEHVDWLMQKYFPHGAGELIVPEPLGKGTSSNPGDVIRRLPRPIYSEPYAAGGKVLSLIERLAGGKPKEVKLPGGATMPAYPIREFEDVADKFAGRYGNAPIENYPKLDEDRARKIAEAYELMQHNPSDPRVKRAYDALIDETMDQYRALEGTGAKFEFLKPGEADPYALSPSLGYKDLVDNGRLKVFPTEQGYGTQTDIMDNPLLRKVGRVGDLENATANDAFRVVHDALGHFGPGNPFFRAPGEERAWLNHMRSYSPDALPAATSETRGQNSWVNFGPRSAENKGASGADTVYADQKAGLLPEWMYEPNNGKPGYRDGGKVLKGAKRFLIDPLRESFSGIYKDPDVLAREAKEHMVPDPGKEGPMYRLFGHTRDSLDELSQGNRDLDSIQPFLGQRHPFNLSGTAGVSPQVLTNKNAGRLVDTIGEALKDPQLRNTRSWYEMSPMYDVMNELGTGDRGMRNLNNRMAVMSAGSDPRTEINRGFHANWLADAGRLDDFIRHGGTPDHLRDGDFPDDLRSLMGHAYHGAGQVPGLIENELTGRLWAGPGKHKVPTYAAATDPKDPYSARPIADSHFNRILGYPDVSTATTEAVRQGVPSGTQYSDIVPWFNSKVAGKLDIRPRDAQALLWNVGGPQTGVRYIGPPKLEMIADYMDEVAKLRQIDPMQARDQLLRGEIGGAFDHGSSAPFAEGGPVGEDMSLYHSMMFNEGGHVLPYEEGGRADDDFALFHEMNLEAGGQIPTASNRGRRFFGR